MKLDWDDFRYFLAVIEHGSTKRAAVALRVDQTTCARRIRALETSLGLQLFTRDAGRYEPTDDAIELLESARSMRAAADALGEQADGRRRAHCHRIRVSSDEALASAILVPAIARLSSLHPQVQVEIDVSRERRDLQAGEADIALRGGLEPNEPGIIRRKIADDPLGIYCSWNYASPPRSGVDLRDHPIACLDLIARHFEAAGLGRNVKHVANSNSAVRAMITQGDVVGVLPAIVAEAHPPLRLCFPVEVPTGVWVVYAERLRGVPEIRDFARLLAEEFRRVRQQQGKPNSRD